MLASNTERLDLYKKDPSVDGDDTFNIKTMMNDNWDKIDEKVAMVDEEGKVVNKDGSPAGGVASVNEKQGNVVIDKSDVGLGDVENYGISTQAEAETGENNEKYMTPQRTKQAIVKLSPEGISEQDVDDKISTHAKETNVHGLRGTSLSLGRDANAGGSRATALGSSAKAEGVFSTALGYGANAGGSRATALGSSAKAEGDYSTALGYGANAGGSRTTALGNSAKAEGDYSTALGNSAKAEGDYSTALGSSSDAIASRSTALGMNTEATQTNSLSLGAGAKVLGSPNVSGGIAIGANVSVNNGSEGRLGTDGIQWYVPGRFTVEGTKNFEMPHPHPDKRETHRLRHSAVESPTAGDNLYRFEIEATEALQEVELELPDYFQYLNKNVDVWVNGVDHFGNAYGKVEGNTLKVNCEYAGKYNVLVIGTRNDDHQSVQDWDIMGVEREVGESWTGETYVFEVDEILEIEEIKEEDVA